MVKNWDDFIQRSVGIILSLKSAAREREYLLLKYHMDRTYFFPCGKTHLHRFAGTTAEHVAQNDGNTCRC